MNPILFYIFAAFITAFVVLMILQKNPISSALCLVAALFGVAALYALLQAHFVAVLQVLVYAGAIMVLFIFVIMLLNLKKEELAHDHFNLFRFFAGLTGTALFMFFAFQFLRLPQANFSAAAESFGTAEEIGKLMFTDYVIPFELTGILLLAGIVGAVFMARREN